MNAPYSDIVPGPAVADAEPATPPAQDESSRTNEQAARRSAFEAGIIVVS
jgi:hypothetical protein